MFSYTCCSILQVVRLFIFAGRKASCSVKTDVVY